MRQETSLKRGQGQLGPQGSREPKSTQAVKLHDETAFEEAKCGSGQEMRSITSMRKKRSDLMQTAFRR